MQNDQVGSKIKNGQKKAKNTSRSTLEFFFAKNRWTKKAKYLAKAIGYAKAIAFEKGSVWVKFKMTKNMCKRVVQED